MALFGLPWPVQELNLTDTETILAAAISAA
jgi:hypothetical protein